MRLRTLGAVCATCAATVPPSLAIAAQPPEAAPLQEGTIAPADIGTDMREAGHELVVDRHVRVARSHARLTGDALKRSERRAVRDDLRDLAPVVVRAETRELRRDRRKLRERLERKRERAAATGTAGGSGGGAAVPAHLQTIAACESGGDPSAVSPDGMYRGKYQFSRQTWAAVGGAGDPAGAPEAEQDRRAAVLYAQAGAGQWPVCGS